MLATVCRPMPSCLAKPVRYSLLGASSAADSPATPGPQRSKRKKATMNKTQQAGFTLIELVMVIVILGVLAAVALPKFASVDTEAKVAALNGVAGALSSASAINYAARKVSTSKGNAVANCTDVATALQGGLPTGTNGYTITAAAVAVDVTVACTLTQTNGGATEGS